MKRVLVTIVTVFGFLGLSSIILFSIMSPGWTFTPSDSSLTADIGANFFGNNAPAVPGQSADEDSTDTPATPGAAAPAEAPQPIAPIPSPTSTAPTTSAAATPDVSTPPAAAAPLLQPPAPAQENNESGADSDLPVATATITVTPTAPQPPQAVYNTEQNRNASASTSTTSTTATATGGSLPYDESNFAGDDNWKTTWGVATTTGAGFLELSGGENSLGGAVYLANGADWSNYRMAVTLEPIAGETFVLAANFTDASNYIFCEYDMTGAGAATMQLGQYIKGYRIDLSPAVSIPWSDGATDVNATIEVNGVYGTCSLGGETVSNEGIDAGKVAMSSAGSGSVGITVDDPSPDISQVIVKHVTVTAE